jgi:hypothetical protein
MIFGVEVSMTTWEMASFKLKNARQVSFGRFFGFFSRIS